MKFWQSGNKARELSEDLLWALSTMFGVGSEDAKSMLYVDKRDKHGGQRVNRVCVFSPATLTVPELAACNYDNLMDMNKGLLFTGHIFEGTNPRGTGAVVLTDQRAS